MAEIKRELDGQMLLRFCESHGQRKTQLWCPFLCVHGRVNADSHIVAPVVKMGGYSNNCAIGMSVGGDFGGSFGVERYFVV